MRKLKYILASVVLATGFASCETEAIDEKVKDEAIPGNPILRFDFNNQQTLVTDKVTVDWEGGSSFVVRAKLSIPNLENNDTINNIEKYLAANLSISYNVLTLGHFPTKLSLEELGNNTSMATLDIQYIEYDEEKPVRTWVKYSTYYAAENQETGFSNITRINDNDGARYLDGNFEYIVYPNPDNVIGKMQPLRLSTGSYYYVNY